MPLTYRIIHGDCRKLLPKMPKCQCVFADFPDNIGVPYPGYNDKLAPTEYINLLRESTFWIWQLADHLWLSASWMYESWWDVNKTDWNYRKVIWYFRFGQHCQHDLAHNYRPLLWCRRKGSRWYTDVIREPSLRQTQYNDKRADPRGRVPGDVWEFPRVCGTFKERRPWFPNQHPEALLERIVKLCTRPGDLVIDPFLGSGTTLRVCQRLKRSCIGIDISQETCEHVAAETGVRIEAYGPKELSKP